MKRAARVLVRLLQIVGIVFAGWQILFMLPALSWLAAPTVVPVGSWFLLGIKAIAAAVALLIAWGLGRLYYRLGGGSVGSVQVRS